MSKNSAGSRLDDEFRTKTDEIYTKNDEFILQMMEFIATE